MAVEGLSNKNGNGPAFLVSAGVVYEIIAAACSSPQTTELNAGARSKTLMKWVNLGILQSVLFLILACIIEPKKSWAFLSGGGLAVILLYWQYDYAKKSGLASSEPPTEHYGPSPAGRRVRARCR